MMSIHPQIPRKVVVIENEPAMVELVTLILENRGHTVLSATGGEAGLELVQQEQPDVVLLDLMMPVVHGWDVYQKMRHDDLMRKIPVIVVTAKAQEIDIVLGEKIALVDAYITKPFSPEALLNSIDKVMAEHDDDDDDDDNIDE